MSELYKMCAAAVISLCAVLILRQGKSDSSEAVVVFFGVLVLSHTALSLAGAVKYMGETARRYNVEGDFKTLIKAAGTAFVVDITSELCRSADSPSLAAYVELFGRCEILILSLPLVGELIELSVGLLKI